MVRPSFIYDARFLKVNCRSISFVLYFVTCVVNMILYYIIYYALCYWNSLISFALERKYIVNKIVCLRTMYEVGFLKYFYLGLLENINHFDIKNYLRYCGAHVQIRGCTRSVAAGEFYTVVTHICGSSTWIFLCKLPGARNIGVVPEFFFLFFMHPVHKSTRHHIPKAPNLQIHHYKGFQVSYRYFR